MMRHTSFLLAALSAAGLLFLASCNNSAPPAGPTGSQVGQAVTYNYTAYDHNNHPVVRGTFTVEPEWPNVDGIRGLWDLQYVGPSGGDVPSNPDYVGPQFGQGRLRGTWESHVWITFNNWYDDQVVLNGQPQSDGAIAGNWEYDTKLGLTNGGTFTAVPQGAHQDAKQ